MNKAQVYTIFCVLSRLPVDSCLFLRFLLYFWGIMSLFQATFLGLIQGFTEFLPVSSSGHLIFLPKIFGWADQGLAFDTVMHLGTLLAVVVYFRKKLWKIGKSYFSPNSENKENRKFKENWL